MIDLHNHAPISGPEFRAASAVMAALDGLAEALTGEKTLWHDKPHTAGSST
jgi:hypothetical protein